MNNLDIQYLNNLKNILNNGTEKKDRTGVGTYSISGTMIRHDMSEGFPALTTKKLFFKTMSVELEGFLKGITDKQWYKDRKCNIWNQWCRPSKIPNNLSDDERKKFQLEENDLGFIYGYQWRNFNSENHDQIKILLKMLENNPSSRRMIVSSWNPLQLEEMALPACHTMFQVIVRNEYLDLLWNQRSADYFLGVPFNIASYGLLLSLLAKQFGYKPGILTGFFGDSHIYKNHKEQVLTQISREPYELPTLDISDQFNDVLTFESSMASLVNYNHHKVIKADIAV